MVTPTMWELISELLEGEKLPVSINTAIRGLCDGSLVVVPVTPTEKMAKQAIFLGPDVKEIYQRLIGECMSDDMRPYEREDMEI